MDIERRKSAAKPKKLFDFIKFKSKSTTNTDIRTRKLGRGSKISSSNGKNDKNTKFKKFFKKAAIISSLTLLFGFLFGILIILGVVSVYSKDLPDIDAYINKTNRDELDTIITDRNGVELYRLQGDTIKERVKLEDVPEKLQWAFLSIEDKNFWNNKGIDTNGFLRAFIGAATNKGVAVRGGGSSITQQLIKNLGANNNNTELTESTPQRKIKEAVLAMQITKKYSKEQILEYYLNLVPEGGILQGVKSGSKYLFGKEDLNQLTLAEMALLAGIPNQPSVYSRLGGATYDPEQSIARAEAVLDRMLVLKEQTKVTEEEVRLAKEELPKVNFIESSINKRAPHYVDYVLDYVLDSMYKDKVDEKGRSGSDYLREKGYVVRTSVDIETQELLQQTIKTQIESEEWQAKVHSQNAAGVIIDPNTGELIAMVGSRDYNGPRDDKNFSPQFNAALAKRSEGSTMKPLNYTNAFMNGYYPSSIIPDIPLDFGGGYKPKNFSRGYSEYGEFITMRTALQWSLNIPAVFTLNAGGLDNYGDLYAKMSGYEEFKNEVKGLAATLGSANIPLLYQTHAYATLAEEGLYRELVPIMDIKDNTGKVIYEPSRESKQVLEKKYAYLINDMNSKYWSFSRDDLLLQMASQGFVGGKTGTGDRDDGLTSDIAFVAYTPNFVMGMWSGNDCGAEECPITGGYNIDSENLYKLVYKQFLLQYVDKITPERYPVPSGVVRVNICSTTGREMSPDCPGEEVIDITADTSLPKKEDMVQKVWVTQCGEGYKLARQIDKDLGLAEEKKYVIYKFDDPRIQTQVTQYQESKNQLPPKEECTLDRNVKKPQIVIVSPLVNSDYKPGDTLKITASVSSEAGVQKVELYLDNILQKTFTSAPYETTVTLPTNIKTGKHKVTVVAMDKRGNSSGESRAEIEFNVRSNTQTTPAPTIIPTILPTISPAPSITPSSLNNEDQ